MREKNKNGYNFHVYRREEGLRGIERKKQNKGNEGREGHPEKYSIIRKER